MSHSSAERTHSLCSHDVTDCWVEKGERKHPSHHRELGFFLPLSFQFSFVWHWFELEKKFSQFKVRLLSSSVSFLLLKGFALCPHLFFSSNIKRATAWISIFFPATVTFFYQPSILRYHDFLNANFTVPKHFSCTFTASYQHTVTFPGTCSASPGKGYEPTTREPCWYIKHPLQIRWEDGPLFVITFREKWWSSRMIMGSRQNVKNKINK